MLFLVLVLLATRVSSQIDQDKALHFLGGNLYGLAGAGIAKQISKGNRWWTFAGAIGGSTLIGLGKEAVDAGQRPNGWDNDDLLATILGGVTVGLTIDLFTNHKKQKQRYKRLRKNTNTIGLLQLKSLLDVEFAANGMPSLTELGFSTATYANLH